MAKLYLWDWSGLTSEGAKLENLISAHLLKYVNYLRNSFGLDADIYYLRDTEGRETDFLFTVDHKPWFAVESKKENRSIEHGVDYLQEKTRVISADKFLTAFV